MSQAAGNGRSSQSDGPCANTIFEHQFQLAWEHFKFHAEQRTRMFHFFLLAAGLLLTAFSWMIRAGTQQEAAVAYDAYAFILLCIGGILSTMFLTLDVRNVQMLEMSEDILKEFEERYLFPVDKWCAPIRNEQGNIRLGIYSRESRLKNYIENNLGLRNRFAVKWILINNIKHKFAIRFILFISIILFWISAYVITIEDRLGEDVLFSLGFVKFSANSIRWMEIIGLGVSLIWSLHALSSPRRDRRWEREALRREKGQAGS